MVAERAGVDLHHQAVVQAHAGHLGEHLGAEGLGLGRRGGAGHHRAEQGLGLDGRQVECGGGGMAVVGGGGAHRGEGGAADAVGFEVAGPGADVLAAQFREPDQGVLEGLVLAVDHRVGAVGGDDAAAPVSGAQLAVMDQVVRRALSGGQDLDFEPFEEGAGAEGGRLQGRVHDVVVVIGRSRLQGHGQAEQLGEDVVQPDRRGRAAEKVEVGREQAPGRARIAARRLAAPGHPQALQGNALRIEHAEQVVVGGQQQVRRVVEGFVVREPGRVGVAVRADDRQGPHLAVEPPGDGPRIRIGRQQAVFVEDERAGHGHSLVTGVIPGRKVGDPYRAGGAAVT